MMFRPSVLLRLKRTIAMKPKAFVVLILASLMLVAMIGYAIWETVLMPMRIPDTPVVHTQGETDQEVQVDLPDGVSWLAPGIEVGKLHYTITRSTVLKNVNNVGFGGIRESAILCMYDGEGNQTMYYYPECVDDEGNLVEGGNLIILDITVTSQDAVNFITNPATGVQSRRYADNPFLFRADEVAYLVDITEDAQDGYTYYDAVYFSQMGYFDEHEMAYEVLPGDSISFRIGFLVGNRPDGTPRNMSDLVVTTNWGTAEKEFYDIQLS